MSALERKIINPVSVRRKLVDVQSNRFPRGSHDILDKARDRPTIGDVFMGIPRVQRFDEKKKKFLTSFDGAPGFVYSLLDKQTSRRSN